MEKLYSTMLLVEQSVVAEMEKVWSMAMHSLADKQSESFSHVEVICKPWACKCASGSVTNKDKNRRMNLFMMFLFWLILN